MEQEKNNKGVIALLVVIIIILLALVVLLATGIVSFKPNEINNDSNDNSQINDNNQNSVDNSLTNETATTIVKDIMDKFYVEVFYGHKETYCGEYDRNDTYSTTAYSYYKSASYSNLSDLKKHLNTYMSSNLVDYMLGGNDAPKYEEKDNKLYCLVWGRGALSYDKDNSTYNVLNFTDSSIVATANVSAFAEGNTPNNITATLGFDKINGVWVLSTYEEK